MQLSDGVTETQIFQQQQMLKRNSQPRELFMVMIMRALL